MDGGGFAVLFAGVLTAETELLLTVPTGSVHVVVVLLESHESLSSFRLSTSRPVCEAFSSCSGAEPGFLTARDAIETAVGLGIPLIDP